MAFSITWNEAYPAGSDSAAGIDTYIQQDKIAVRERLESLIGIADFATRFPMTADSLKMGGTGKIVSGATSLSIRNNADAVDMLKFTNATSKAVFAGAVDVTGMLMPLGRLMLPMGEASYFNTVGTNVVIGAMSDGSTNMVQVAPASAFTGDGDFDNGGANDGTIRYIGATTRYFHIAITLSGSPATNNDSFVFGCAKGATVISTSKIIQKFGVTTDTQATALHAFVSLATNDKLTLYVGNLTAGRNFTVKSLNVFAMGM